MPRVKRGEQLDLIACVIGEARNETPGLQVLGHVPQGLRRKAPAFQGPAVKRVAAAAGETALYHDLLHAVLRLEPPVVLQVLSAGKPQTVVTPEIGWPLRHSVRRKIGRRGAKDASRGGDLACYDCRILGPINAKSDVNSVLPNLKASVGENQMRLQSRMLSHEFGKQWCDPPSAKLHRRSDLQ